MPPKVGIGLCHEEASITSTSLSGYSGHCFLKRQLHILIFLGHCPACIGLCKVSQSISLISRQSFIHETHKPYIWYTFGINSSCVRDRNGMLIIMRV